MHKQYLTTPSGDHVASIPKSGSSSIAKAVLCELYPDKVPTFLGADPTDTPVWQGFVPKAETPENPCILVRDPVKRFASACVQAKMTPAEAIAHIESAEKINPHFSHTSAFLTPSDNRLFLFPDQLPELAKELGLSEIGRVHASKATVELSKSEIAWVKKHYKDDCDLFNSIKR